MSNLRKGYASCIFTSHVACIGALDKKTVDSGACPCGCEKQNVEHVLFECVNINLNKARRKFKEGYSIYVNTYCERIYFRVYKFLLIYENGQLCMH